MHCNEKGETMKNDFLSDIVSIANERGFCVETCNGSQRDFSLEENEIALVCNKCGRTIKTPLDRPNILEWLSTLECQEDECPMEEDERILTKTGVMQWCKDSFGVAAKLINLLRNQYPEANLYEVTDTDTVYFGVNSQSKNGTDAVVFVKYISSGKKHYAYIEFHNVTIQDSRFNCQMEFCVLWTAFEEELEMLIQEQLQDTSRDANPISTTPLSLTLNRYIYWAKSTFQTTIDLWKNLKEDEKVLERFIKSHLCPVCGFPYTSEEKQCSNCGFGGIHKVFLNISEGQYWKSHDVPNYQRKFFYQHFKVEDGTVRERISANELRSIIIPDSIICLGAHSLLDVNSLQRVVCPSTLQIIEDYAFNGSLIHISLPNSLRTIGKGAFWFSSIRHIMLPNSLETIEDEAFFYCSCLEEIVIPSGVGSIGKNAFELCSEIKQIVISNGVEQIQEGAFTLCRSTKSISIPASVTVIGVGAFTTYSSDVVFYVDPENIRFCVVDNCLVDKKSGKIIAGSKRDHIPRREDIKTIGEAAYGDYCYYGEVPNDFIVIPPNIERINSKAFCDCSISKIYIPSTALYLGENAFDDKYDHWFICEADAKPVGWDDKWCNPQDSIVSWGMRWKIVDGTPEIIALDSGDYCATIVSYSYSKDDDQLIIILRLSNNTNDSVVFSFYDVELDGPLQDTSDGKMESETDFSDYTYQCSAEAHSVSRVAFRINNSDFEDIEIASASYICFDTCVKDSTGHDELAFGKRIDLPMCCCS